MRPLPSTRFRPFAAGLLAASLLAACRARPEPEAPFHAGEARRSELRRQAIATVQPPERMADAVVFAPVACHGSFGEAVAIATDLLVVGAPQAEGEGRAWVYDTRHLDAPPCMLQPPKAAGHQRFGASVAVSASGEWIAIGAPHAEVDGARQAGAVYLWHRDAGAWTLDHVFTDPDADTANEHLGAAVAVQDDCVIAGAPQASMRVTTVTLEPDRRRPAPPRPGEPERPPPSGEPREVERVSGVFEREGAVLSWNRGADGAWGDPTVSLLLQGRQGAGFGSTISLDGNQAAVGAPVQRTRYGDQGGTVSIYFRREGMPWRRNATAVIAPSTAEPLDQFGAAIACAPRLVVVGLPNANLKLAPDAGRVAVYRQNLESRVWVEEWWSQEGWDSQILLQSPAPETGSEFGRAVAVSGRQVVVGQPNTAHGGNSGRVFVFEKRDGRDPEHPTTWQVAEEWVAPAFARVQRFGAAMDGTDAWVAVAAPGGERATGCVVLYRQTAVEPPEASEAPATKGAGPEPDAPGTDS